MSNGSGSSPRGDLHPEQPRHELVLTRPTERSDTDNMTEARPPARAGTLIAGAIETWSPASKSHADRHREMSNGSGPEPAITSAALLPADMPEDRRAALARAINALVEAGFGFNSAPAAGVISMQRAWQGPGEDLVMVDVVTFDTQEQALAVREGVTGQPVWGPERGVWSAVVAAVLSQSAPQGYSRVAARGPSVPDAEVPVGSISGRERLLMVGLDGEEELGVPDDVSALNGVAVPLDEVAKSQLLDTAVRALRRVADRVEGIRDTKAYREIPDQLDEVEDAARALDEVLRASL